MLRLNCSSYSLLEKMGSVGAYQPIAQICIDIQDRSLPKRLLLSKHALPSKSRLDVTDVPRESGLLTDLELHMTEQDATGLLQKYQTREWTVRAVIVAFLKRATIGQ